MSRWFRVYDDLVDDPKVQRLSSDHFRALINLWCLASQNSGYLPPLPDIAFKLRLSEDRAAKVLSSLEAAGLLATDETGIGPHNWSARQFKSDVSNERVKRHRERQRNVTPTVTVTPPDTETDTETKTVRTETNVSGADAPNVVVFDARKALFDDGLAVLSKLTGKPVDKCRSLVGKWLKATNDDAQKVRATIMRAAEQDVAEAVSWIEATLVTPPTDWRDDPIYRNVQ